MSFWPAGTPVSELAAAPVKVQLKASSDVSAQGRIYTGLRNEQTELHRVGGDCAGIQRRAACSQQTNHHQRGGRGQHTAVALSHTSSTTRVLGRVGTC